MTPGMEMSPALESFGSVLKWSQGKLVRQGATTGGLRVRVLRARDEAVSWTIWLSIVGAVFLLGLEWSFGEFGRVVATLVGW